MRPYNAQDPYLNRKKVSEAMFMLQGRLADEDRANYEDFVVRQMGPMWSRYNGVSFGEQEKNEAWDNELNHVPFDDMAEAHDQGDADYPGLQYFELSLDEFDRVMSIDGHLWEQPLSYNPRQSPFEIALDVAAGLRWE